MNKNQKPILLTVVLAGMMLLTAVFAAADTSPERETAVRAFTPARMMLPPTQTLPPSAAEQTATLQLTKTGPNVATPQQIVTYQIQLDNLESVTRTFQLTDTLPVGLDFVTGSATGGLAYDDANRRLTWQGEVGPGAPGYTVLEVSAPAYLNLGETSEPPDDLCGSFGDCDEATAVFDLGAQGESVTLFGDTVTALHVNANGFIFGPDGLPQVGCTACPQRLPQTAVPNQLVAGLWRDVDMSGGNGQWYAAVVTGLLVNANDAVFYANWHNAGHFGNPFLTSRHAIAIVLDGQSEPAGRIYVMVDYVSDRATLAEVGYTIGVENAAGEIGTTVAYAPCHETPCIVRAPVGSVPAGGTTLRFDPAIVPGPNGRSLTYRAQIAAPVGTVLQNEAVATSSDGLMETAVVQTLVDYRTYFPIVSIAPPP